MIYFKKELTEENIYKEISGLEIFKAYCQPFKRLRSKFSSEFRVDPKPSCVITSFYGNYYYKDFGSDETLFSIQYVMKKFSLSHKNALIKINTDFGLKLGIVDDNIPPPIFHVKNEPILHQEINISPSIIKRQVRLFNNDDLEYWRQYGATIEILKMFNVEAISAFWIDEVMYIADKYAYCFNYYWESDVFRRKIYQPFSQNNKWYGNGGNIVQGENMLPYSGDLLIITKSLKDVMTLYSMGYTSIALPNEHVFFTKEYFNKQKSRFKNILLFLDNDKTGVKSSNKFSSMYNIKYFTIPVEYEVKDISDFIKKNKNQAELWLKTTVNNIMNF